MNKDQTSGAWEAFKGKAKGIWGELTEDDFLKAEGSMDKLYGTIQSKFGDTKEKIQEKLSKLKMS
ncbi:MAG: CsbD family protein [Deltaproteobacteria bacterium]|nr:MAG: CsbD family protein [Deltaproteobacteria bacterium]